MSFVRKIKIKPFYLNTYGYKEKNIPTRIKWEIIKIIHPCNINSNNCRLCLKEKLRIIIYKNEVIKLTVFPSYIQYPVVNVRE